MTGPTVRAELPAVTETSVAVHVELPKVLLKTNKSPQFCASPAIVSCVPIIPMYRAPVIGGEFVALVVTSKRLHVDGVLDED